VREPTPAIQPPPSSPTALKKRWPPAFGELVRQRREALDLTQDAVALLVDDARPSIANIERAGRPPYERHDRIRSLAIALQTDPEALIRLAEECRAAYSLPGSGPGVTNRHRELALVLETRWGTLPDDALLEAMGIVDATEPVEPRRDSEPSPFGAWLLQTRLAKNVSQLDLGRAMGIARSYVSMVENGSKGASFPDEKLVAVATVLDAAPDDVRTLVAQSRQFYKLDNRLGEPDEVSVAHRKLASALVCRWLTLPAKTMDELRGMLAAPSRAPNA
jgi:transcriptional regulator with XRE-family HTH domain